MQPQQNQPTEPIVPEPPAQPPVQTQPAAPPVQAQVPQGAAPITPLTQADFLALAKKNRKPKRIIVSVLVLLAILGIGFLIYSFGLLGGMKTVKYDNGKGKTYSLKFYARNKVEPLKSNASPAGSSGGKAIIAKKGKDDKAPLSVYITTLNSSFSNSSEATKKAYEHNSNCYEKTPVARVYNAWAEKEVSICDFVDDSEYELIYYSTFKNKDDVLFVLITQDANFENAKTPEKAKALLKTIGLDVYQEDIKQIVASIKPASD